MGLNHLQSLICTYSADDLRPLMNFKMHILELFSCYGFVQITWLILRNKY